MTMEVWMWLLILYAVVGGLFAVFLLILRARTFDKFDYIYCQRTSVVAMIQAFFLWPLLLLTPRSPLKKPYYFLRAGNDHHADQQRRKWAFIKNPPPSGRRIKIQPSTGFSDDSEATFIFDSRDLLEMVQNKLVKSGHWHPERDQHEMLHAWLSSDPTPQAHVVDVPGNLRGIADFVDQLVRERKGEAQCPTCGKSISAKEIVILDPGAKPGWNFSELQCPEGTVCYRGPLCITSSDGSGQAEMVDQFPDSNCAARIGARFRFGAATLPRKFETGSSVSSR